MIHPYYKVTVEIEPDGGMLYGLSLYDGKKKINGISYRLSEMDALAKRFTDYELSPVHFMDAVLDYLNRI